MRTHDEDLSYKILMRDGEWGMTGCLEVAKAQVALRGHDVLDDLSQIHVRLLALMCSGLPCNQSSIETHFDSDIESLAGQLQDLDVKCQQVLSGNREPGDRWFEVDAVMRPVPVVEVGPGWQSCTALI